MVSVHAVTLVDTLTGEDVSGVTLRESASGGAEVEALGLQGSDVSTDDSAVLVDYNGLTVDVGGLDDLLVDGLGVLNDS